MGGVAVADGSTLSTTGEMQVTCSAPYVLSVDGVEWVPTASAGGVDTYLLSTSGVVRIFINGTRYFIFKNELTLDMPNFNTGVSLDLGGTTIYYKESTNTYAQFEPSSEFDIIYVRIFPSGGMSVQDVVDLGITAVQGSIGAPAIYDDYVAWGVSGLDINSYNAVFVGNTLVTFVAPLS